MEGNTSTNRISAIGGWLRKRFGALVIFLAFFALWESAVTLFGITLAHPRPGSCLPSNR